MNRSAPRPTRLLDVNVLIALIDPMHSQHEKAHQWFESARKHPWATCPLTQNGVLRIVGHPRYFNSPGSPAAVSLALASLCEQKQHVFWPDDLSVLQSEWVQMSKMHQSEQVTDTYLLALAASKGGQLATFDARLRTDAVKNGERALCVIA